MFQVDIGNKSANLDITSVSRLRDRCYNLVLTCRHWLLKPHPFRDAFRCSLSPSLQISHKFGPGNCLTWSTMVFGSNSSRWGYSYLQRSRLCLLHISYSHNNFVTVHGTESQKFTARGKYSWLKDIYPNYMILTAFSIFEGSPINTSKRCEQISFTHSEAWRGKGTITVWFRQPFNCDSLSIWRTTKNL